MYAFVHFALFQHFLSPEPKNASRTSVEGETPLGAAHQRPPLLRAKSRLRRLRSVRPPAGGCDEGAGFCKAKDWGKGNYPSVSHSLDSSPDKGSQGTAHPIAAKHIKTAKILRLAPLAQNDTCFCGRQGTAKILRLARLPQNDIGRGRYRYRRRRGHLHCFRACRICSTPFCIILFQKQWT